MEKKQKHLRVTTSFGFSLELNENEHFLLYITKKQIVMELLPNETHFRKYYSNQFKLI